eukprot:79025_1
MAIKMQALEQQARSLESIGKEEEASPEKTKKKSPKKVHSKEDSPYPPEGRQNPYADVVFESGNIHKFSLKKTFQGHSMPISKVAMHPRKPIVATASDDKSWKMWSIPNGELI